jgi:glycosyltransferase involved in cell wall biosynthesis
MTFPKLNARAAADKWADRRSLLSLNAYHYRRGGADTVYLNHAELMERYGWENSFFSMHHPENLPCPDQSFFAEEIDYAKCNSFSEMVRHAGRIIYSVEARKKIAGLLDSRRIDIAHVHSIYHHLSPSVLLEIKERGIPIVMTAHDLKLACPAYTMLNRTGVCERCRGGRLWNVAIHRCVKDRLAVSALVMAESAIHRTLGFYSRTVDRIITPSEFYRQKLIEWGWDPTKLVTIRNFVSETTPLVPSAGGTYILYFGRLSPEKGLATLIRGAAQANVPVKIAGRGPQESQLRGLAKEISAPVEFLGFLSGEELWRTVIDARAIVLPSEWYENCPMSVIEAFQRGKPLIGARIGGIPELIVRGETGWDFTSGNVEDLARVLEQAWGTPSRQLAEMANACRSLIATNYSAETYFNSINELYSDLL